MQVKLTVPSKTFLIGEYAVLEGGSALVLSTEPRFEAVITTPGEGRLENIHRNSPAGLWARWNKETFQQIDFLFQDPHEGRGGFGASSAQFLLTWIWNQLESRPFSKLSEGVDLEQILKDYLSVFENENRKPSGADLMAQTTGGLTQVKMSPLAVQQVQWPFEELDFLIVPTGNKVATHKHLSELSSDGLGALVNLSQTTCQALEKSDKDTFLSSINQYASELENQGKTVAATTEWLNFSRDLPGVLAAKGCGALGADSFVVVVDKKSSLDVRQSLEQKGLPVLASALSVSQGLGMQLDLQGEVKSVTVKTPDGFIK